MTKQFENESDWSEWIDLIDVLHSFEQECRQKEVEWVSGLTLKVGAKIRQEQAHLYFSSSNSSSKFI